VINDFRMAQINAQPLPKMFDKSEIMTTTTRQIKETRKLIEDITKSIDVSNASFKTVVKSLIDLENAQSGERAMIAGLKYFSPSLECQQLVSKAEDQWREFESLVNLDLYVLLVAVRHEKEDLCIESSKLLDTLLLEYEENGYGRLHEVGLQRVLDWRRDIERLQAEYHQNLRQQVGHECFDRAELLGLPEELLTPANEDGRIAISLEDELTAMSMHYTRTKPAYMEAWKLASSGKELPPEKIPQSLIQPRLARRARVKSDRLMGIL